MKIYFGCMCPLGFKKIEHLSSSWRDVNHLLLTSPSSTQHSCLILLPVLFSVHCNSQRKTSTSPYTCASDTCALPIYLSHTFLALLFAQYERTTSLSSSLRPCRHANRILYVRGTSSSEDPSTIVFDGSPRTEVKQFYIILEVFIARVVVETEKAAAFISQLDGAAFQFIYETFMSDGSFTDAGKDFKKLSKTLSSSALARWKSRKTLFVKLLPHSSNIVTFCLLL